MLVFGGKNEENEKVNDLWRLDIDSRSWTKLNPVNPEKTPTIRSGHSTVLKGKYMMIFGGIYEITKELNDAHLYDVEKNEWILLFQKKLAPSNIGVSPSPTKSQYSFSQSSPLGRRGTMRR